jgi:hypothetical protein
MLGWERNGHGKVVVAAVVGAVEVAAAVSTRASMVNGQLGGVEEGAVMPD